MGEGSLIKTRKVIVSINKAIDKALTVLFLIVLFLGIYFAYDSYYVFNAAGQSSLMGYKPDMGDTAKLKELSEDVVAWLTINDTTIDYPIVQGDTNSEYLNKNAYGDYSLAGSIFLDFKNDPDFTDDYSILYGHHMSGGYMFGALDDFEDETYFNRHLDGLLTTINGDIYDIKLFAFMQTDANERLVFDVNHEGDRHAFLANNADIYREASGRILALSTCKSPLTTERTVLFGILTPHVETEDNATEPDKG